jgi:biotin transport system substrate-specific component
VGVVAFTGLTAVGAHIYLPLTPVPMTLQTLFVLLAGAVIGGRRGALSQTAYVALGAFGVPLFAGSLGGWGVLAGPTGGYLVSFAVVPFVVGALLRSSRSTARQVLAFSVGTALIFAMGVAHLAVFWTHDVAQALRVGLLPFIPGAVFKIVAATSISRSYSALVRHRRGGES